MLIHVLLLCAAAAAQESAAPVAVSSFSAAAQESAPLIQVSSQAVALSSEPAAGFLHWYDARCGLFFNKCLMSSALGGADMMQDAVSRKFVSGADTLDKLISRRRTTEENSSSALVSVTYQIGEDTSTISADINVRLKLPRTEGKMNLVVEHVSNEVLPVESITRTQSRLAAGEQEPGSFVGLRYIFGLGRKLQEHVDFGAHVDAQSKSPYLLLKPQARANASYSRSFGGWDAKTFAQAMWSAKPVLNVTGGLYLAHPLLPDWAFTSYSNAVWQTDNPQVTLYHTFSFPWKMSARDLITPAFQLQAHSYPAAQSDQYTASLSWRRRLWKDWLSGEATPSVNYPRDRCFHEVTVLTLRLDMLFGNPPVS
ncbi:MAG: hypothetical protein WC421_02080 [Elusimicrobiales bacterium]